MRKAITLFTLFYSTFVCMLFSSSLAAEQKVVDGNYHVHYSVFPSTAISAEVASVYKLRRSDYRAIINITPQKVEGENTKPMAAVVSGSARNLIGNTRELEFREIVEQGVVYYIAEFPFSNEEHFRFDINVIPDSDENKVINLKFEKKFFRE